MTSIYTVIVSVTYISCKNLFHILVTHAAICKIRRQAIIGLTCMTGKDNLTLPTYGCQVKKTALETKSVQRAFSIFCVRFVQQLFDNIYNCCKLTMI